MKPLIFKGCLFDLDGTLVSSIESVNRTWRVLIEKYDLDTKEVLSFIQGRPADESVRELLRMHPSTVINSEISWLKRQESEDTEGVVSISSSLSFLNQLDALGVPWGIVTSCNQQVAIARMKAAKMPFPKVMITFEDVRQGKPDPEPYLLGAKKLGVDPESCLVFEDAPAGVTSATKAGCSVFGVLSHLSMKQLSVEYGSENYDQLEVKDLKSNWWQICFKQ
ncbi:HAD-IA family hydrolase [Vibrio parahaemolyticus]|uniref:HAD-IA family hydrolase n=1 Tax=Vibrio parahaemolyticus TaxID=670 RepID=UPI00111D2CA0|nr:HAD-IA family hydrolase [Vibrio parahaemolyticus]MBM4952077.1 HAD-IA family hydrolase [Vibrio parahaemolyticus]MDA0386400.1 HAD-IA family hydrolase [Vibrio parahaemolyticus]MDA0390945.1 HAD-IA family hydrolase [Vibrio parahaemolyticus]MDA0396250.1 HAD-IA family hydrolase [Vibrio parahaemolyticus]MDA0400045.1 HAD-IA family hydrolase [Vibrio parahaemolyticus]